ncbi:MAG: helix-turn-helix transcriptional regulator [Cyclobacteriaceae bacterium]|nr:helix-turn-helix transcriptional regulator [Cyclobacteriaceae bacterium]
MRAFQTVEKNWSKVSRVFSGNGQPILKMAVKGNYGNFGYHNSFHSFAINMEDKDIKDRILQGATELFMRYGIRSVSMDDVARHLSMSKKTLYHLFRR